MIARFYGNWLVNGSLRGSRGCGSGSVQFWLVPVLRRWRWEGRLRDRPKRCAPPKPSSSSPASIFPITVSMAPPAAAASTPTARLRATSIGGRGAQKYVVLPTGTLRANGDRYCASLRGIPFEPCFNLTRTSGVSFRGSISGFGFAYCDFTRRGCGAICTARAQAARTARVGRGGLIGCPPELERKLRRDSGAICFRAVAKLFIAANTPSLQQAQFLAGKIMQVVEAWA